MTGNEYQKLAMRTAGDDDAQYLLENGVMGLRGIYFPGIPEL